MKTRRTTDPGEIDAIDHLLVRYLEGADETAMEEFVHRTRSRLLGAARRIGDPQDAEDTVQAVYHALLRRGSPAPEGPVVGWLLTTVVRLAYRRKAVRRRQEDIVRQLSPREPAPGPPERTAAAEEAAAVRRAVLRLPPVLGDALVLHHLQGLGVAETARILDVPLSTAKARLRRGRALLRTRLPLSLHLAVVAVPWTVADAWRSLAARAPWAAGGIVKTKTAVIIAAALGACILAATAGLSLLPVGEEVASAGSASGPAPGAGGEAVGGDSLPVQAPAEPFRTRPAPVPAAEAPPPPPPERPPVDAGVVKGNQDHWALPEAYRAAAREMGVSEETLGIAWEAHHSGARGDAGKGPRGRVGRDRLEALGAREAEGFRAVVALLKIGQSATWIRELAAATWEPGLEELLIQVSEDPKVHIHARWSALDSLSGADCPRTRDYLVGRLASEMDSYLFDAAAGALASLHEARGAEAVLARVRDRERNTPRSGSLMFYLVEMDPQVARTYLLDYLRDPGSNLLVTAVALLKRIDMDLGRAEAAALLDGPRAATMDAETLRGLQVEAGRWKGE